MAPYPIVDDKLLKLESFGKESLIVLYALLGVDRINDQGTASHFFWENIGQTVLNWHNLGEGSSDRDNVANALSNHLNSDTRTVSSNISRACNIILRNASVRYGLKFGTLPNSDQIVSALLEASVEQGEEVLPTDKLRELFPGLRPNPEES